MKIASERNAFLKQQIVDNNRTLPLFAPHRPPPTRTQKGRTVTKNGIKFGTEDAILVNVH